MLVENLKSRVITVGVNLKPGVNTLRGKNEKTFMKEIETAERYSELGIIKFLDKDVLNLTEDILDLPIKEAIPLIKNTFDTKELKRLKIDETKDKERGGILGAIESQMQLIHSKSKKEA